MTNEEWRSLPDGFGPYEVSDHGAVRNSRTCKVLKPEVARTGHLRVQLYVVPGKARHFQVHRLVARAFIGESDLDVLHWDDNPSNNHVSNLRYGTDRENWYDSARNGRRRLSDFCLRGHPYSPGKRCFICEGVTDRRRYWERVDAGISGSDPRQGTYAGYRAGCRCEGCNTANRVYKTEWARENRRRKRELRS